MFHGYSEIIHNHIDDVIHSQKECCIPENNEEERRSFFCLFGLESSADGEPEEEYDDSKESFHENPIGRIFWVREQERVGRCWIDTSD